MKKYIFLALACFASSMPVFADFCMPDCCSNWCDFDTVLNVDIGGGYRQDRLRWKTFPVTAPGIEVSEKWKDISMGIVEANAQLLAAEHFLFKVDFDYGWFDRGGHQIVTTTDLATDTSVAVKSRTKGHAYDISGGIGYQFNWCCNQYSFAPLVGYSYHEQKFNNHNYTSDDTPSSGSTASVPIGNKYRYRWDGPWLGFAAAYQVSCEWQFYFNYAYHWAQYRGKIEENFVLSSTPGHQKTNNASGNEFTVGTTYAFDANWYLGAKFNYKIFTHNKGHFRQTIDGVEFESPLRKLRWESFYATIDIGYVF